MNNRLLQVCWRVPHNRADIYRHLFLLKPHKRYLAPESKLWVTAAGPALEMVKEEMEVVMDAVAREASHHKPRDLDSRHMIGLYWLFSDIIAGCDMLAVVKG